MTTMPLTFASLVFVALILAGFAHAVDLADRVDRCVSACGEVR